MNKIEFAPGTLKHIFYKMGEKVKLMKPHERICAATLDEMAINPAREFDSSTGSYYGHPTMACSESTEAKRIAKGVDPGDMLATHALAIMLCGITVRWKQMVGFHYTDSSFDAKSAAKWIIEVIEEAQKIGLTVKSLAMDNGPNNRDL